MQEARRQYSQTKIPLKIPLKIPPVLIFLLAFAGVFFRQQAQAAPVAQIEHQLVRRLVVFPMRTEEGYAAVADESWWQAREELTRSRRFLVASKQFLVRNDTFQPRGELEPADAIILGKLLDAHALFTSQLKDRTVSMQVYDASTGLSLWQKNVMLHPSLTVQDQLPGLMRRMAADFVATIPYQGYTMVDSMIGRAVYQEGNSVLAQVDLGIETGAKIGDNAQWIQLIATTAAPVFQGGSEVKIFAEGKIIHLEQGVATIEILRMDKKQPIKEYSLVRVPREAERLLNDFTIRESVRTTLTTELVSPEANPMQQIARERRPLITTLSLVGSLAAFLLLAF
jgi:hypothetical protein